LAEYYGRLSEKQEITGELFGNINSGYGVSNHLREEVVLARRQLWRRIVPVMGSEQEAFGGVCDKRFSRDAIIERRTEANAGSC
jgi:hypothetical protein